jgi:hypothetical protein
MIRNGRLCIEATLGVENVFDVHLLLAVSRVRGEVLARAIERGQ